MNYETDPACYGTKHNDMYDVLTHDIAVLLSSVSLLHMHGSSHVDIVSFVFGRTGPSAIDTCVHMKYTVLTWLWSHWYDGAPVPEVNLNLNADAVSICLLNASNLTEAKPEETRVILLTDGHSESTGIHQLLCKQMC